MDVYGSSRSLLRLQVLMMMIKKKSVYKNIKHTEADDDYILVKYSNNSLIKNL